MTGPNVRMVGLLLGLAVLVVAAFGISRGLFLQQQPPVQPIRFPHQWHVQSVGLECGFCHRTAATTDYAGVPAVEQCMFCHRVAGAQSQEIRKVVAAANENRPVDWIHVYRVPDHVRFTHAPHVQASVACSECHGDVANTTVLTQARTLKMGDCLGCHRQRGAPTDCWTCHY